MTSPTLRELFEAALELPPATRAAWLDRHCDDTAMRARIELMLDWATHSTGDALPVAPMEDLAAAIGRSDMPPPGTRIGPFELIELLGEGGYASVFRAVRESAGVRQEVALKLLRYGVLTPHAQRQFLRERQALAQLRHPNIAGLIEGGVTESGVAYIALELVDGVPITQYARDRKLDLRARLGLFLQVCRAVEAAHRALIVHRDLKPANVLVTAQGRVLLLDFGVAKLLENDDETQTRAPGFTPAYAAPEQHRGEAITTATDVYALGILLGELATGQRLNDGSGRTPSAQVDANTELGVLPAPPRTTMRLLRGDLDNIVLKAIDPEPTRRYASAGAFADDIERHLAGRTVSAHPPSRLYRMRKFVHRHKGGVASTIAFSLAVFAALGVALWQAGIARQEAARATEQSHRAEMVRDFLVSVFEAADTEQPREYRPGIEDLVDDATRRALGNSNLRADTRADLLATLARVNESLGAHEQALAAIDAALPLVAGSPDDIGLRLRVQRAATLTSLARPAEAIAELAPLRATLDARDDMLGVEGLLALANALSGDNQLDAALGVYADARKRAQALPEAERDDALLRADSVQASALVYAQRFKDGLALADAAWQRWQASGAAPDLAVLDLLGAISVAAEAGGDMARADTAYRDAIALAERHYTRPHPRTAWLIGVYGSFLVAQTRYDDAEPYIQRALDLRRSLLGDAHPDTLNAIAAMGRLRAGQQRRAEAMDWFAQGIALCRRDAVRHNVCPRLLGSHAQMVSIDGDQNGAAAEATEAVTLQTELTGADSPQVASMLGFLARIQVKQEQYDAAIATVDRLLAIYDDAGGGLAKDRRHAEFQRALALYALKRNDEALALATRLTDSIRTESPDDRSGLFSLLALKARALSRDGKHDTARATATEALALDIGATPVPAELRSELERIARGERGR